MSVGTSRPWREQDGVDERWIHGEALHRDKGGGAAVDEESHRIGPHVDAGLKTPPAFKGVSTSQELDADLSHIGVGRLITQ